VRIAFEEGRRMRVFITRRRGGLGRALAACAQRGWDLFLTDGDEALKRLKAGLRRRFPADVRISACDLTDERT
jgi:short-subunit dehydrogenase